LAEKEGSVTSRDPGAAACGLADAFRIPHAIRAVGSLFSTKQKRPLRGVFLLAEKEGFEPSIQV
jgi:hypothetical protein